MKSVIRRRRVSSIIGYNWANSGGGSTTPWWLAGGLIPESTDYTIYDPLAAADLATSYINLANPGTRNASTGVAPTHAQGTGWEFNGSTQFLNSQTKFLVNHTIVVWNDNWLNVYVFGSSKIFYRAIVTTNARLQITTALNLVGPSTNSIIAMRSAAGAYRNGKKLATLGTFNAAGTDYDVYIGCQNNSGSAANFGRGYVFRYAHYNFVLSDAQCEALFDTMRNYNLPADVSYKSVVLSLNPIAYYTMNQNIGRFFIDETGGKALMEAFYPVAPPSGVTVGNSGPTGKGFSARGFNNSLSYVQSLDDWAANTGLNMGSFSFSCWVKNNNANTQARVLNIWSNTATEYWALEIRSGNIGIFIQANGASWNNSFIAVAPDNTWTHLVGYNDTATGKTGVYINGTKYEFTPTTGAYVDTSPDQYYPYVLQSMDGYMCHVAFFDHPLSQSEVDALNV